MGEENFSEALRELDRSEVRIVIRVEIRKARKPVTIIEGLPANEKDLEDLVHRLKKILATGGTAKGGHVLLQGDQREKAKNELVRMGYHESNIVLY